MRRLLCCGSTAALLTAVAELPNRDLDIENVHVSVVIDVELRAIGGHDVRNDG
jgi:hypothetical protein